MKEFNDLIMAAKDFESRDAFLFDMDGLLFDTEQIFMEQLAIVMKERGYTLTREIYCKTLGMTGKALMQLMCDIYGEDYPFHETGHESRRRVSIIAETVGLRVKPQIRELLIWLQNQGKKCAVVSSTQSEYVKKYLDLAGLSEYFEQIVGGEMVEKSKPEPDIFLLGCERLGVMPKEAVVLEDSENGIRGAYRAGIATICIPDLKEPDVSVHAMIHALVRTAQK